MNYNKYINSFADSNEYNAYIESDNAYSPNIGFIEETKQVKWAEKVMKECIFYGTTEATTDFMIGSSLINGIQDCINVHVVQPSDGSDNIMYASKEDIVKTLIWFRFNRQVKSIKKMEINTSNVTDMKFMFSDCSALTSLNVSNFDTSKVTDMYGMFKDCYKLTSLDLSNFDTSKATIGSYVLANCSKLTSLKLSASFFNSSMDNYYYFRDLTSWTEATSLSQFVNAISSKDGTGKTVNLSDATKTALTDAQKMQIRDAKWTIA